MSGRRAIGTRRLIVAAACTLLSTAQADESLSEGVTDCRLLTIDAERLACYDALTVSDERPSAQGGERTVLPLDDSVGKGQVDEDADDDEGRPTYTARLVRCGDSSTGRIQLFYLENGQVWRQRNSGGMKVRECDVDIEITRDMFGFRLVIPSQNRSIRVARVR